MSILFVGSIVTELCRINESSNWLVQHYPCVYLWPLVMGCGFLVCNAAGTLYFEGWKGKIIQSPTKRDKNISQKQMDPSLLKVFFLSWFFNQLLTLQIYFGTSLGVLMSKLGTRWITWWKLASINPLSFSYLRVWSRYIQVRKCLLDKTRN